MVPSSTGSAHGSNGVESNFRHGTILPNNEHGDAAHYVRRHYLCFKYCISNVFPTPLKLGMNMIPYTCTKTSGGGGDVCLSRNKNGNVISSLFSAPGFPDKSVLFIIGNIFLIILPKIYTVVYFEIGYR